MADGGHVPRDWSPVGRTAAGGIPVAFGEAGEVWVRQVGARFRAAADELGLVLGGALDGGLLSAVCAATDREGRSVVVKSAFDPQALELEARALIEWGTRRPESVPEVLAAAHGCLVLERVEPGTAAVPGSKGCGLDRELDAVAGLLAVVADTVAPGWARPADEGRGEDVTLVRQRLGAAIRAGGEVARDAGRLLGSLGSVVGELAAMRNGDRLVHGDLWPNNVLVGPDGWVMIDPWPAAGRVEADAAMWAVSAGYGQDLVARLEGLASRLGLDREALWVHAALACISRAGVCWAYGRSPGDALPALASSLGELGW